MIVLDLWQSNYQILLLILRDKFANLSVKVAIVFLKKKMSIITWQIINVYLVSEVIQTKLMKFQKINFRIHLISLMMMSTNLFSC